MNLNGTIMQTNTPKVITALIIIPKAFATRKPSWRISEILLTVIDIEYSKTKGVEKRIVRSIITEVRYCMLDS